MKSLLMTAVVVSSFATQSYADPVDGKAKESAGTAPTHEQPAAPATVQRPEVRASQPQTAAKHGPAAPFEQPVSAAPPAEHKATSLRASTPAPKVLTGRALVKATPLKQKDQNQNQKQNQSQSQKQSQNQNQNQNQKQKKLLEAGVTRPGLQPKVLQATGKGAKNQAAGATGPAPAVHGAPVPPVMAPGAHAPLVIQHGLLTPAQVHEVQLRNQAFAQKNPRVLNFVETRGQVYRAAYHEQLLTLQRRYLAPTYLAPLRVQYRPWAGVGFYAYAYPVRPVVEFYTYFSNPCVAWFYNDYDAEFYQPYYGQYFTRYPDLNRGYNHVGIYLPTEEFIAMNVALSELRIEAQINYRRAMIYLGDRLADRYRAPINRHQVIVNHYVMLPSNRAVIVEGFVDNEHNQMPFRALVDLNNADHSQLFAVGAWKADDQPSAAQAEDLYDLNDQVVEYGGSLEEPPSS